jgi:bile acid:Na+ symporter, BASS family
VTLAVLLPITVKASIALTVFALGLRAETADATSLLREPLKLLRSMTAMAVVMPLFAVTVVLVFDLHPAVRIALVALSVSPVPPIWPRKASKAGGSESYTIGLLVASAVFALLTIPSTFAVLRELFGLPLRVPLAAISKLTLLTVLIPLAAGMAVRHNAPRHAARWVKPVSLGGTWLLVLALLPALIKLVPAFGKLVGDGTLAIMAAFVVVGLATGFLLGGPKREDRVVLALAASSRHPGIALVLVHLNYPDQLLAPGAIVLYMIVGAIVSLPYLKWSERRTARAPAKPALASR